MYNITGPIRGENEKLSEKRKRIYGDNMAISLGQLLSMVWTLPYSLFSNIFVTHIIHLLINSIYKWIHVTDRRGRGTPTRRCRSAQKKKRKRKIYPKILICIRISLPTGWSMVTKPLPTTDTGEKWAMRNKVIGFSRYEYRHCIS